MKKLRPADYDERKERVHYHGRSIVPRFYLEEIVNGKCMGRGFVTVRPSYTKQARARLQKMEDEVALAMLLGARGEREGTWGREASLVTSTDPRPKLAGVAHYWINVHRNGHGTSIESVCGGRVIRHGGGTVFPADHVASQKRVCGYCCVMVERAGA